DFASFKNILPDAQGNITVKISRIGVWTYLAGFIIYEKESDPAGRPAFAEETQTVYGEDIVEASTDKVSIYPNPFVGSFNVALNNNEQEAYRLILTDIMGRNVMMKDINKKSTYQ